ncbi:hypothetical protein [Microvirga sp. BSC39]|uniref:DUF6894 family protein n=1 Tax=Microvirga sp. BSC39 TaxID=1549810 RepID=UPI00055DEBD9|nr:hypothetical protein [Microvirga sp. BSC39]
MPRFYFDVREDGEIIPDQEGLECESLDAAEHLAAVSAADIGRDLLPKGNAREITIEVKDGDGFLLVTVTVAMSVRRTVRALV